MIGVNLSLLYGFFTEYYLFLDIMWICEFHTPAMLRLGTMGNLSSSTFSFCRNQSKNHSK